ncbi:MAG: response regulator [Pseudomonadota bacterium]
MRILVVEDEPLFAGMLADLLDGEGFEVIGPARTAERARTLAESAEIDAAILDIQLIGGLSLPAAYALEKRGIPFLFLTSRRQRDLPADLQGQPLIEKPFDVPVFIETLHAMLTPEGATGLASDDTDVRGEPMVPALAVRPD